jgi:predicted peroxiredoxin
MSKKFCVTLAECRTNGDKATLAFVVANAALASDKDTLVFLSADGAWAAARGEAEKIDEDEPFAPLKDLVDKFIAGGGKLWVCTPCMKKRQIGEDDLIEGAQPAGGAALVEWLSDGSGYCAY